MAKYTDIDLNFSRNPITNDVSILQDADAIKSSVKNIILTNFGERPFNSIFGSGIRRLLFEPLTVITASSIRTFIETALENFEPRVEVIQIDVYADTDNNAFQVTIGFRMLGDTRIVLVPITLKRLR